MLQDRKHLQKRNAAGDITPTKMKPTAKQKRTANQKRATNRITQWRGFHNGSAPGH